MLFFYLQPKHARVCLEEAVSRTLIDLRFQFIINNYHRIKLCLLPFNGYRISSVYGCVNTNDLLLALTTKYVVDI